MKGRIVHHTREDKETATHYQGSDLYHQTYCTVHHRNRRKCYMLGSTVTMYRGSFRMFRFNSL